MRGRDARSSNVTDAQPIPLLLVRDLVAVALVTEERPSARSRLERSLGADFVQQLLSDTTASAWRAA